MQTDGRLTTCFRWFSFANLNVINVVTKIDYALPRLNGSVYSIYNIYAKRFLFLFININYIYLN